MTSISADPRIGIFLVASNAESRIETTLAAIPASVWDRVETVYVVDDCSTDETVARILPLKSRYPKLEVYRNRISLSHGGNQKAGLQFALDRGLDFVALLDTDGRYAPDRLEAMFASVLTREADVAMGTRMDRGTAAIKEGMPALRYAANRFLTMLQNAFARTDFSEYHCGFRVYSTSLLRDIPFWDNSDDWHFDTQILLQFVLRGARVVEVPVPVYYGAEISHVRGLAYGMMCLLTSLSFALHRSGLFYSRVFDLAQRGRKYTEKFNDPYSSHSKIWKWLSERPLEGVKVLELGVGDASLTRRLKEAGAIVDGIEIDPPSLEMARPFCRHVYLQDMDAPSPIPTDEVYDLVIAADVLEHLRNPSHFLSRVKPRLRKGGHLVVSLPNIANAYVRLNLLLGRFPLHSKGLLDRTHLHCFTLKTAEEMLERTGWIVDRRDVTAIPFGILFPFITKPAFRWSLALFHGATRMFKGLLAYQSLFFCHNPNHGDLL